MSLLADMPASTDLVSVIIPVLDNPSGLALCLHALATQIHPPPFEVIVIDNSASEDHRIKDVVSSFSFAKYLHEAQRGSYFARNKGLLSAGGDIIAFTDSDCIPASDWLTRGLAYFNCSGRDIMLAGRIDVFCRDRQRPSAAELHELVFAFPQKFFIEKMRFAATANMWTSREVLDMVGVFPKELSSGGDRSWGEAAHAKGVTQLFADDVLIRHPARYSFTELSLMYTRIVRGDHDRRIVAKGAAFFLIIDLVFYTGILLRQSLRAWRSDRLNGFSERLLVVGAAVMVLFFRVKAWFKFILGGLFHG